MKQVPISVPTDAAAQTAAFRSEQMNPAAASLAADERADDPGVLADRSLDGIHIVGRAHDHHPDTHVEHPVQLVVVDAGRQLTDELEQRSARPRPELDLCIDAVGQHPRQVLGQPAAGDVGECFDLPGSERRFEHVEVGAVGFEQRLTERDVEAGRHRVHRDPVEQLPQERVPVRVRPARRDPDQCVSSDDVVAGEERGPVGDADERAGDVERAGRVDAGHLGGLAAQEDTPGCLAGLGHAGDDVGDAVGVEDAGGDVVEEEPRPRRLNEDVVDAVVDDVDPDAADPVEASGEFDLRADAIGRRDDDRVVEVEEASRGQHATEAPDALQDVVAERPFDGAGHALDRAGALVDVDARRRIGREHGPGGSPSDVAPDPHVGERHAVHAPVGSRAGCGEVVAHTGHCEHAATGRLAVGHAGREQDRVGFGRGVVGPLGRREAGEADRRPGRRRLRIPRCRCHDGARGARAELDRDIADATLGARRSQRREVGREQRQDRLRLGIAESTVVFDQAWAVGGEHQPGVEHADVGRSGRGVVVEDRLHERREQFVGVIGDGRRRVGAHAAGVRAGVALADPLVVLCDRQRHGGRAIAEREQRALGTGDPFLEHERADRGGRTDGLLGLGRVVGHDHALAGCEPVELDDDRSVELGPPRQCRVDVAFLEALVCRAGHTERGRQMSRVPLRRLDPRLFRRRAEARDLPERALVGDTGDECCLGAGDDQVDVVGGHETEVGGDRRRVTVLFAGPRDRVLAAPAADDEDAHQASDPSNDSFAWASSIGSGYAPVKHALQ